MSEEPGPVAVGAGTPERVLVVAAHPDDVDFGAAGTVATWTAAGVAVSYCLCTDGDAGGFDPAVPRGEVPRVRRAEQRAAAAEVGVSDVVFLGHPDGDLEVTRALRRDLAREIRRVRPQVVVAQAAERTYRSVYGDHPDHVAAGEATLRAVYPDARNPFAHPELLAGGLEAWTVPEVWVMAFEAGDRFVDVTDAFPRKLAALRAHVSQTAHMTDLEPRMREWLGSVGRRAGLPEGRLAEGFRVVRTV